MMTKRRWILLTAAVLTLAAFNLSFRIDRESLTEWDSALYALSAWEMLESHDWVGTTSNGALDYYNSKPPLNIWLIALAIKNFGPTLVSTRAPSLAAAWLTILLVLLWASRRFGPAVGLLAGLVLTTSFGFLYVHSGRSANPDAPMTLALLAIVILLDGARDRPWRRAWLGVPLAAVFMLKGMAVVMPLLLVAVMEMRQSLSRRERWSPLLVAASSGMLPVLLWAVARWQVDRWEFFRYLFLQDFVAVSATALDGHAGSPFFYLNILLKHHYDWTLAAIVATALFPPRSWATCRQALAFWRTRRPGEAVLWWAVIALLVPSLMQTKLPWYLNPFYPVFAIGVAWTLAHGLARRELPWRRGLLIASIVLVCSLAETRLLWYSYHYRALDLTAQGVLLAEAHRLEGSKVFGSWNRADLFVLRALVGADAAEAMTIDEFLSSSEPDTFLVSDTDFIHPALTRVATKGRFGLFAKHP